MKKTDLPQIPLADLEILALIGARTLAILRAKPFLPLIPKVNRLVHNPPTDEQVKETFDALRTGSYFF